MGRQASAVRERELHEDAYDGTRADAPSARWGRPRPMFISDVALRADGVAAGEGVYDAEDDAEDDAATVVAYSGRVPAPGLGSPPGGDVVTDHGTVMMAPPARREPPMPLARPTPLAPPMPLAPISGVHPRGAMPESRRRAPRASSLPALITVALLASGALIGAILGATQPIREPGAATRAVPDIEAVDAPTVLELPASPVATAPVPAAPVATAPVPAAPVATAPVAAVRVAAAHAPAAPARRTEPKRDAPRAAAPRAAANTPAKTLEETLAELGEQQLLR